MVLWRKLGIIAGGGDLPVVLAEHCAATGRPYFIARIAKLADPKLENHPGATHDLGQMGRRMEALHGAQCDAVVLLGKVSRPDLSTLDLDEVARSMLPALAAAKPHGDDALLRAVLVEHERAGFRVIGADEIMADLLAPEGAWGEVKPTAADMRDLAKAARIAAATGALDIGQGAVVCAGLVLAVEAQEGTDAMLRRVGELPQPLRGAPEARRGVLAKRPKPIQERRIDLPVVGVHTIEAAAAAGLAGVAVEAHGALAVRRDAMIDAANRAGIFIYGFSSAEVSGT